MPHPAGGSRPAAAGPGRRGHRERPAAPVIDPAAVAMRDLVVARALDPDIFRVFLARGCVLALPHEIMARPGPAERGSQLADGHQPALPPGPSRAEPLRMLS
jgi:hypothetical protein